MKRVLFVEDSKAIGWLIKNKLETENDFDVIWVQKMSEAMKLLDKTNNNFFAGLLDLNLPDAPNGEIVKEVVNRGIPVIIFSGSISEEVRDFAWSMNVVDYVLKDNVHNTDHIVSILKRIDNNADTKVLVVDDSSSFRKYLTDLLKVHCFKVYEAQNGEEALNMLVEHPDTKLVITDFNMPKMDGVKLTQKIREKYRKDALAIIGVSSEGKNIMAASFIKNGANDFIIKQSFIIEEFYSRVNQCIENIENIQMVREAAIKDFLTGLYNRRYFFEYGQKLFASAVRKNISSICAMLDIDYFKKVNDTYGHEAGDIVLKHVSSIINGRLRETDIVARIGGEEFCILAVNMGTDNAQEVFEDLLRIIEESPVSIGSGQSITVTVSAGVCAELADSLEDMVKEADELLYKAKKSGRNKVLGTWNK